MSTQRFKISLLKKTLRQKISTFFLIFFSGLAAGNQLPWEAPANQELFGSGHSK